MSLNDLTIILERDHIDNKFQTHLLIIINSSDAEDYADYWLKQEESKLSEPEDSISSMLNKLLGGN